MRKRSAKSGFVRAHDRHGSRGERPGEGRRGQWLRVPANRTSSQWIAPRCAVKAALVLTIATLAACQPAARAANTWDGGATFGGWLQALNWDNNANPTFNNSTVLTFSTTNWTGTLANTAIENAVTLRGINIGQGWATAGTGSFFIRPITANNSASRVLTFSSNSGNAFVNVTSAADGAARNITFGGSNVAHPNGTFTLSSDLDVTNSSTVSSITFNRPINGAGRSITKLGAGVMVLDMMGTGSYGYTGATAVTAGILQVNSAANIDATSGISVAAGGRLIFNSATALTKPLTLSGAGTGSRAVLSGTGTIGSAVTLDDLGDVLSPGDSPGILPFNTSQAWSSYSYDWEVNDWTGTTAGTAFDQVTITGGLDLTGTAYQLNLLSLTSGNAAGLVPNFSETTRSWTILTTTTGITGFQSSEWTVNAAGFSSSPTAGGTWSLATANGNNDLVLSYTAVVPEPAALALWGGLGLLAAARFARRRADASARR